MQSGVADPHHEPPALDSGRAAQDVSCSAPFAADDFAGHSHRRGLATTGARIGAAERTMMATTATTATTVRSYVDDAELFTDPARQIPRPLVTCPRRGFFPGFQQVGLHPRWHKTRVAHYEAEPDDRVYTIVDRRCRHLARKRIASRSNK